jgi:hypothetical protein
MAEQVNEGSYRISGRFGEVFDEDGIRLMEVSAIEFTVEIAMTDVPIPGSNRNGTKDGPEARSGEMTVQKIDTKHENRIYQFLNYSLAERRRMRDEGRRPKRTFRMQVWLDDPDALGAEGWQLEGVRLSRLQGGFNIGDEIINRTHPFRYEAERKIKAYERIGNEVDSATGLPKIRYTDDLT